MIAPDVSTQDAARLFPDHRVENLPSGRNYLRITSQPK